MVLGPESAAGSDDVAVSKNLPMLVQQSEELPMLGQQSGDSDSNREQGLTATERIRR